jgi:hypothetical protein
MMTFAAPYPAIATITKTPNPQLSDQESLTSVVTPKRAINGTLYTYVKKQTRRKVLWTLSMDRGKALEFLAFVKAYSGSKIQVTDHRGDVWVGYFTNNPFEFDTPRRAAGGDANSLSLRQERQLITIEFEGEKIV